MAKVKYVKYEHDGKIHHEQYWIQCPGCKTTHAIGKGPGYHTFNGDFERPTFQPSLLCTWNEGTPPVTPENLEAYRKNPWPQTQVQKRCHSFIINGRIQFLPDCTHALAGQTVDLPDIKEDNGLKG